MQSISSSEVGMEEWWAVGTLSIHSSSGMNHCPENHMSGGWHFSNSTEVFNWEFENAPNSDDFGRVK